MLLSCKKQYQFGQFQAQLRSFGGAARAQYDSKIYRSRSSSAAEKERSHTGHKRHLLNNKYWREVKESAPSPIIVESFPSELYYDPKIDNESMEMEIDGRNVKFEFNAVTSTTSRKKPKAQLTSELLMNSAAPRITLQTHGHFYEVKFSRDSVVYVLYATRDSPCPLLRDVCNKAYLNTVAAGDLEKALDELPPKAWEDDHHAGGRYVAVGIGSMDKKWHKKPFFLSTHKYKPAAVITQSLCGILTSVAAVILNYVPEAFRQNENLKCNNENVSYPPLAKQSFIGWFSTQVAIRRVGQGCKNKEGKETESISKKDLNIVALHADKGDLSNMQPLVYIPRGGDKDRGGCIADSELIVAENETGGKYVRIQTNCEDTVCIVLFDSSKNLHGLIEGDTKDDPNAYCTRIIPFIT